MKMKKLLSLIITW